MPHTYSKNKRTKRPDYRPNGKQRQKQQQAMAAATPVEELMKTKIHSSKRKERPVTGALKQKSNKMLEDPDSMNQKRSRALQKLLRQIEVLAEKQNAGKILDEAQLEKLGRFDAVVAELEEIMDPKGSDDGEESESDDENENENANESSSDEEEQVEEEDVPEVTPKSKQRAKRESSEVQHSSKRRKKR